MDSKLLAIAVACLAAGAVSVVAGIPLGEFEAFKNNLRIARQYSNLKNENPNKFEPIYNAYRSFNQFNQLISKKTGDARRGIEEFNRLRERFENAQEALEFFINAVQNFSWHAPPYTPAGNYPNGGAPYTPSGNYPNGGAPYTPAGNYPNGGAPYTPAGNYPNGGAPYPPTDLETLFNDAYDTLEAFEKALPPAPAPTADTTFANPNAVASAPSPFAAALISSGAAILLAFHGQ